jgi:lipopolysaccharide exporter
MFWKAFQLGGVKVIFLARTLILARLLAPDDFGLLAISLIAVDVLMSVTNLGMIPALVQSASPDERHYNTAWTLGMGRAILVAVFVFFFAPYIAEIVAEPRSASLIQVMALRPILEAAASIKLAFLTRQLRFRSLAYVYVPEALVNTGVSIALAPLWGVWGLVAGILAGPVALVIMSYLIAPHRPRLTLEAAPARGLIRFGRWIFLGGIIAISGSAMVQMVISRQLGVAELGLYFLAAKLAFIPAEISGEVVSAVAFPLYSRLQADVKQVARAFRAILSSVSALVIPICVLMVALAPSLVAYVLGPRWESAAHLIQLLALVNIIGLFGDTAVPIFKGLGQPNKFVLIEVIQSTLLVVLIWGLVGRFGVIGAPLAWLTAVGMSQLICAIMIQRLLSDPFTGLAKPMITILFISGLAGVAAWAVTQIIPGVYGLLLAALLGLMAAGILYWLADRRFALGLRRDLSMAFPYVSVLTGSSPVE